MTRAPWLSAAALAVVALVGAAAVSAAPAAGPHRTTGPYDTAQGGGSWSARKIS